MKGSEFMAFRKTDQYASWMSAIRVDYPNILKESADMAIFAHMSDPLAYRKNKNRSEPVQMPTRGAEKELAAYTVYSGVDDPDLPYAKPIKYANGVETPHLISTVEHGSEPIEVDV